MFVHAEYEKLLATAEAAQSAISCCGVGSFESVNRWDDYHNALKELGRWVLHMEAGRETGGAENE